MDQTQNLTSSQTTKLISISELFPKSFAIYKPFFWKLAGMYLISLIGSLPLFFIFGLYFVLISYTTPSTLITIIYIILALVGIAAILFAIYVSIISQLGMYLIVKENNPEKKIWDTFKTARPMVWDFFGTSIIAGVLIMLWTLLLVIPGIIMALYYQFFIWVFLFEGLKWKASLNRSKELVKGHWWAVFGRLLLPVVIIWVVMVTPAAFVGKDPNNENLYNLFSQIMSIIITPFFLAYTYHLYKSLVDLKNNKPTN